MGHWKTSLFIFIFLGQVLCSLQAFAQNRATNEELDLKKPADARRALRLLRDAYRASRDQEAQHYQKQESVLDPYSGLCIECEELTTFTNQINNILTQLPETNPHSNTEIAELVAHSAYTELVHENGLQQDCYKQVRSGMTREFRELETDDAIVIFQGTLDVQRVESFSLYGKESLRRTLFLRGKDSDADKIIRVDLRPGQDPHITLYHRQDAPEIWSFQNDKVSASLPSFERQRSDRTEATQENQNFYTRIEKAPEEEPHPNAAQLNFFDMEYSSSGLPEKITLLDFRDRSKMTENFDVTSDIEISSDDQEMLFGLARTGRANMAEMRIEKEGDVEVAFDMNLPTGIVQSQLLMGSEGPGAQFQMQHTKNSRTRLGHTTGDQSTSIEHSTTFGNSSRLGLSFKRARGQNSGHVEYRMIF